MRAVFPGQFSRIAAREAASGFTIHRSASVAALADRGRPYAAALTQPGLVAQAEAAAWTLPVIHRPWTLPAGAYGEAAGPV